jgi:hypothetical protein
MIGAEPLTDWLPEKIEGDDGGYLLTGLDLMRPRLHHARFPQFPNVACASQPNNASTDASIRVSGNTLLPNLIGGKSGARAWEREKARITGPSLSMRAEGLEPPRAFAHRLLRPACLPIPPRPRAPRREIVW